MQVLLHHQINPARIPNFAKLKAQLEAGDFRSAQTKKVGDNLFRARLDRSNRILFMFGRHQGRTVVLILEYIANHAYEKSRFLSRGQPLPDGKLPDLGSAQEAAEEAAPLTYLNPKRSSFNLLDKVISFDDAQHAVYALRPPMIVIGSAGSGKTVLTLEKLKEATGQVLYVTRSRHLADSSRGIYYAMNYENDRQDLSFLSYAEFIESIRVPDTREVTFTDFARWFARHRVASRLRDPYQLFEEINGVITGSTTDRPWLTREAYLALGVRQSIYALEERERVYALFTKYLAHLQEAGLHDANLLSFERRKLAAPAWDFIVIDEVQDFTTAQMDLVLRTLKEPRNFILCGDANQIVHPNFFSWSGLKRHFHGQETSGRAADLIRLLHTNYRNAKQVTEAANRILRLKHARFRSVDKESNYLVESNAGAEGAVALLADEPAVTRDLDEKTHESTRFAVIVMHAEQKAKARRRFRTPLTFTVQEAKGLEYDNVVLYDFVSGSEDRFAEIVRGVLPEQVRQGELRFGRAKDKSDKSLEIFKFHINALYVAATRAVTNLYFVESRPRQRLFDLLGMELFKGRLDLEAQSSSLADWQREAQKLERQGKAEQAEEIRTRILGVRNTPWKPLTRNGVAELTERALGEGGKKAKLELFEYALLCDDRMRLRRLANAGFRPALRPPEKALKSLIANRYMDYSFRHANGVRNLVNKYGVDHRDRFNCTPLMLAAQFANAAAVEMLTDMGANASPVNSAGLNAFQIMLGQARASPRYARHSVPRLYGRLTPGSIDVKVDDRLVKLEGHQAEFLFYNLFVALFHGGVGANADTWRLGLRAADLETALGKIPPSVLPAYRTRRRYISQVLARNELNRDAPYNRRLFKRTHRGFYVLNPALSVRVSERWVAIYDLLDPRTLFSEPPVRLPREFAEMARRSRKEFRSWAMAIFAGDDPGPSPF